MFSNNANQNVRPPIVGIDNSPLSFCPTPQSDSFRFLILFITCFLSFGSFFCFDLPTVLEKPIREELQLTSVEYNLFYSIYSWTYCIFVIPGGIFVDWASNRSGAILFNSLIFFGQFLFALGGTIKSYPLMCAGRFFYGPGGGSIFVAQLGIISFYFQGKELALGFGVMVMASRLGSILNLFTSAALQEQTSLVFVLWFSVFTCLLSLGVAGIFFVVDRWHENESTRDRSSKPRFHIRDVMKFPLTFWLLAISSTFFFMLLFSFIANGVDFLSSTYAYSAQTSGSILGIIYLLSIPGCPLIGQLLDFFGMRTVFYILGTILSIPPFLFFLYSDFSPIFNVFVLGFAYIITIPSVWPSIPLIVPSHLTGTAVGLTTSINFFGVGFSNLIVGILLDHFSDVISDGIGTELDRSRGFVSVNYFLLSCGCVSVVMAFVLFGYDFAHGRILFRTKRKDEVNNNPIIPDAIELIERDDRDIELERMIVGDDDDDDDDIGDDDDVFVGR
jgi:MFS family permease